MKAYYEAVQDMMKKQMEKVKKMYPKMKMSFKETKIEGDKGQIIFSTGMGMDHPMDIIKVNGKWFLNSADVMFKEALTMDLKKAVEKMRKDVEEFQSEGNEMSAADRAKMDEGMRKMNEAMEGLSEEDKKIMKEAMENMPKPE